MIFMWHISGCSPSQQTIENEGFVRDPPTNSLDGHPGCRCCTDGKTCQLTFLPDTLEGTRPDGPIKPNGKNKHHLLRIPFQKICKNSQDVLKKKGSLQWLIDAPRNHWGSRTVSTEFFTQPNQGIWSTKDTDFITAAGCYRGGRGLWGFLFNLA